MENAEFKINKPSLLIEACRAIDAMQISAQNQDVQGDLYEYLLPAGQLKYYFQLSQAACALPRPTILGSCRAGPRTWAHARRLPG